MDVTPEVNANLTIGIIIVHIHGQDTGVLNVDAHKSYLHVNQAIHGKPYWIGITRKIYQEEQ